MRTLELRTTQEGVIWPRRPLISAKGLLSSVQNVPYSSVDKRPTCFRDAAFNAAGDVLAAVDERGRVFVFFVTANHYALVQHLGVPAITCCFNPARKTELLVTCENDLVRWTACLLNERTNGMTPTSYVVLTVAVRTLDDGMTGALH